MCVEREQPSSALKPMALTVNTNFQSDTITGIRDADFAKEAFQRGTENVGGTAGPGGSTFLTGLDTGIQTGDGFDTVRYETGLGEDNFSTGGGGDSFNCDDILLGHGAIGYEMQAGIGISANARGKTTGSNYSPWDHDVINASDALINPDSMRTAGYAEAVGLDSSSLDSFAGDPLVMGGTTLQNYQVPNPDKSLGDCTCDDTLLDKSFGMSSSVIESTGSMDQSQPWLSGESMDSLDLSQTVRPSVDLF